MPLASGDTLGLQAHGAWAAAIMGAGASVQEQVATEPSTLAQLPDAARKDAVRLSQKFGGGGALPSASGVSVHAAVETGSRLAKHTHEAVLAIYNQTFVGTGGNDAMTDGCLASRYALELLGAHHRGDPTNAVVGLCLAEVQLRFGQLLGVMAQNNAFDAMEQEFYVLEPLGLSDVVTAFEEGVRQLKGSQRLFETHAAAAQPFAIGACAAALGELYYCSGCSVFHGRTGPFDLDGMDGAAQCLESLRLSEEAIELRKAAGLESTAETANICKDLGKVYGFMEEMVVEGIILDAGAYGDADQLHSRAEKYLLKAADINKVMGSSASTDANLMRLMKSSGIKCRETAEKRGLRVAERVEEVIAEHELAAAVGETLGEALEKDRFIAQLASVLGNPQTGKRLNSVSKDLLAFGYHADQAGLEERIIETAKNTLQPPISKDVWKAFKKSLLKSNIWFRRSTNEAAKGELLFHTLLAGAATEIETINAELVRSLEPFATGIARLSEPDLFPNQNEILRQDELDTNEPDFTADQLPNEASRQFYDMKVYLPKLMLVARMVNGEYQAWVETNFMTFGEVLSGPIKTLERAEAKAENDYGDKAWPTSAHIIDLVRARLVVNTPEEMEAAVKKALALCEDAPSNSGLVGLARLKNSFLTKTEGFRDIKLSIAFASEGVMMICELGICLRVMDDFGHKVHILYEVERERTFYEEVEQRLVEKGAL